MFHKDKKIHNALTQLFDELCQHERDTSRRSTVIIIPHDLDMGDIIIAQDGKPTTLCDVNTAVHIALEERAFDVCPKRTQSP